MRPDPAPMTLANMRANGVRTLAVSWAGAGCHHDAVINFDAFGDDVAVPAFGPRMRCQVCGLAALT